MLMNRTFKRHNAERRAKAVVYMAMCTLDSDSSASYPFDDRLGQHSTSINSRQFRH
jgi:hypothetical protein